MPGPHNAHAIPLTTSQTLAFWVVFFGTFITLFWGLPALFNAIRRRMVWGVLEHRGFVVIRRPSVRVQELAVQALGFVPNPWASRWPGTAAFGGEHVEWIAVSVTSLVAEYRFDAHRKFPKYVVIGVSLAALDEPAGVVGIFLPPGLDPSKDIWSASREDKVLLDRIAIQHTRRVWPGRAFPERLGRLVGELEREQAVVVGQ